MVAAAMQVAVRQIRMACVGFGTTTTKTTTKTTTCMLPDRGEGNGEARPHRSPPAPAPV
jgi:hypothetical protein